MTIPTPDERQPTDGPERASDVLQTVLATVPEAVFLVRPDGREILGCNPAAEELFGYPCSELLGRSTEILHLDREHFEEFGRRSEEVLRRGKSFTANWQMRRKDGSVFSTSHTITLIDENLGLGGGVVSLVRERDKIGDAASRLDELERRYEVLFEHNPEGLLVYEVETGLLLEINATLAQLYGGDPKDLVGRRIEDLVLEEDRDQARDFVKAPLTEERRVARWRARRHDGAVRHLRTTAAPVTFDGRPARLVVVSDVTEQLEAEKLARRLLAILDATPDFVGIADFEEKAHYVNPAGRRMVGMEELEDSGTSISDYMTGESVELVREEAIPAALEDGVWTGETVLRHRSGEEIPVSQVVIAHRDPETGAGYLSTIARDMREHHRLEEQLRQAQKIEAIGRLAGGVAHDFNNILTTLGGYAELALEKAGDETAVRRYLGEIRASSERAEDLTRQLLAFSRRQTFQPRVQDLRQVVGEAETVLRATLPETLDLDVVYPERPAPVEVDRSQLQQVLLNLAVNARDALPEGGLLRIVLEMETLDAPRGLGKIDVPPGEYAVLRVADTGVGIEPEVLPRVFEPFFTTKGAGEGTGLGLSTVYGIVKQSGGFIEVESEPGEGTTFTIFLPRAEGEPEAGEAGQGPPAREPEPENPETVLLVEDDRAARMFLNEVLEGEGYRVLQADCAESALEMAESAGETVDLLVTDVVLPKMDGRELSQRLREGDPSLLVVLISGYSYESLGTELEADDGTVFLQKPFSGQELLQAVGRLLGEKRGG